MTSLAHRLLDAMSEMPVIDAHEHLPPEKERVARDVDVFTLFGHYTQTDIESAGMRQEQYDWLQDPSVDLDERWQAFEPYCTASSTRRTPARRDWPRSGSMGRTSAPKPTTKSPAA